MYSTVEISVIQLRQLYYSSFSLSYTVYDKYGFLKFLMRLITSEAHVGYL